MALSPNAPDYVSQVRGIISDVREDYLKKQQLFQQQQQAGAQLALGYAQLSAQRDNQARQADLDSQRIELEGIKNQRDLEGLAYNRQRQAASDRLELDKLELIQEEKRQKIDEIDKKNKEDAESGRIYSYIRDARNSGDPDQIAMAESALDNTMTE
jgi:tRNA uridine 5-carbamoylmethylation protein Kti12